MFILLKTLTSFWQVFPYSINFKGWNFNTKHLESHYFLYFPVLIFLSMRPCFYWVPKGARFSTPPSATKVSYSSFYYYRYYYYYFVNIHIQFTRENCKHLYVKINKLFKQTPTYKKINEPALTDSSLDEHVRHTPLWCTHGRERFTYRTRSIDYGVLNDANNIENVVKIHRCENIRLRLVVVKSA